MANHDISAVKRFMGDVIKAGEAGKSADDIGQMAEDFLDSRAKKPSARERAAFLQQVQFLGVMNWMVEGRASFREVMDAGLFDEEPAVDAKEERERRRRIREENRKAEAEARAEEAKHRKKRLARGLSARAGTGKAEPAVTIWGTGRPVLRYAKRGISLQQMMKGMNEAKAKRDRALMEKMEIGATRLGGLPDLPAGVEWPRFKGRKIPFVAQLNFSELPKSSSALLPRDGHLMAFALLSNEKGCYPSPVRVLMHRGEAGELRRADWPGEEEIWPDWGGVRVYEVLPGTLRSSGRKAGGRKGVEDEGRELGRVLGKVNEADEEPGELADAIFADGGDWINLLALRSVGSMEWSDSGELYFLVRRSALKKLDFSGVVGQTCGG